MSPPGSRRRATPSRARETSRGRPKAWRWAPAAFRSRSTAFANNWRRPSSAGSPAASREIGLVAPGGIGRARGAAHLSQGLGHQEEPGHDEQDRPDLRELPGDEGEVLQLKDEADAPEDQPDHPFAAVLR